MWDHLCPICHLTLSPGAAIGGENLDDHENERETKHDGPGADGTAARERSGRPNRRLPLAEPPQGSPARGRLVVWPDAVVDDGKRVQAGREGRRMKSACRKRPVIMLHTCRVVALFGQARLIRKADGRFQLEGGNRHDRLAAIEWTSMFLPEAVVSQRGQSTR